MLVPLEVGEDKPLAGNEKVNSEPFETDDVATSPNQSSDTRPKRAAALDRQLRRRLLMNIYVRT